MKDTDIEAIAWANADERDLWVFDKLIVARKMHYNCGPAGKFVDKIGKYIIRPCVNIPGMGRGAEFVELRDNTDHIPNGYFWCEIFQGRHLSIDYENGKQILCVEGTRNQGDPLWKFNKWFKTDDIIPMPAIFHDCQNRYKTINIEYIGGKVIEVHFRRNTNFDYGNNILYPKWQDEDYSHLGLRYIPSPSYHRKGYWVD